MKLHDWRFGSLMAMLDHRDRLSRAPGRTGISQGIAGGGAPTSRSAVCTAAARCSICSSSPLSAYPCIARRAVPPEGVAGRSGQPATGGVHPGGGAGGATPRCTRGDSGQRRLIGAKAGARLSGVVCTSCATVNEITPGTRGVGGIRLLPPSKLMKRLRSTSVLVASEVRKYW